ncbi:MAG: extracellular solute-binding protein [Rhodospirillales bacterium]
MPITRRQAIVATSALTFGTQAKAAIPRFEPSAALLDAAKREGGFVNYTAQIEDLELETIAAFNKRFPFVKVEIVHLPGGQLIERIKAEIGANKLVADLIDHSEPSLLRNIESAFRPYAPPNAADYIPEAVASPRIWPRITAGTCIAWNKELIKDRPTGWWDIAGPKYAGQVGMPSGYTGGSTWVWVMFQRKVLSEDYWAKQAAIKPRVYTTNAVTADALIRGEIGIAPVSYPSVMSKIRDGAPLDYIFPIEGVPCFTFADGIPATSKRPAAAQLYLDWCLSEEGQGMLIRDLGHLTALKKSPSDTPGLNPAVHKLWFADRAESDRVRDPWLAEWSKTFGMRQ